jgi:hypothetical protein
LWERFVRERRGAALRRLNGVSAAVFPSGAERAIYNNACSSATLTRHHARRQSTR